MANSRNSRLVSIVLSSREGDLCGGNVIARQDSNSPSNLDDRVRKLKHYNFIVGKCLRAVSFLPTKSNSKQMNRFTGQSWNDLCGTPSNNRKRRWPAMTTAIKKQLRAFVLGFLVFSLGAAGCGTLTGATLGGATGAAIGAGTHSNVGRSAAIGAGVGGTGGALYDVYNYGRYSRRNDRDRDWRD
jgi:hypothetical protein